MVKFAGGEEIYLMCDGQRIPEYKVTSESGKPIAGLPRSEITEAKLAKSAYVPGERGKTFTIHAEGFRNAFGKHESKKTSKLGEKKIRMGSQVWSQGLYCGSIISHHSSSLVRTGYSNDGTWYKFEFAQQTTGQLPREEGEDGDLDTAKLCFYPAEFIVTIKAYDAYTNQRDTVRERPTRIEGNLQTTKAGSKAHEYGCGASGKAVRPHQQTAFHGKFRKDLPTYRVKFLISSARLLRLQAIMPDEDEISSSRVDESHSTSAVISTTQNDSISAQQSTLDRSISSTTNDSRAKIEPGAQIPTASTPVKTENTQPLQTAQTSANVSTSANARVPSVRLREVEYDDDDVIAGPIRSPAAKRKRMRVEEAIDLTID